MLSYTISSNASTSETVAVTLNDNSQTVRIVGGLTGNTTSSFQDADNPYQDSHANAPIQAAIYIVVIIVIYLSVLTIIIVRYTRKERNKFHLPRYLLKRTRSLSSPNASSSFRAVSGRRTTPTNMDNSVTTDFVEVTQCLNTVSNHLVMDIQQTSINSNSATQISSCNSHVEIDTTAV
ncbi:hypothetical protein CHUAL_004752 [Chamberlinius hualienensis]